MREYNQLREELLNRIRICLIDGLKIVNEANSENVDRSWFWSTSWEIPVLSYFDNGFSYVSAEGKTDYVRFLYKNETQALLPNWSDYHEFVINEPLLCKHFQIGEFLEEALKNEYRNVWEDMNTRYFLASLVNSYIHIFSLEFNEDNFFQLIDPYLNSIFSENLVIDIYVPILLLKFEFERFEISEKVWIEKISDQFQISRGQMNKNVRIVHPTVSEAATHAFVLKNWSIKNNPIPVRADHPLSIMRSYSDASEICKQLFAALRIVSPHVETGFSQIFSVPLNWRTKYYYHVAQTFSAHEKIIPLISRITVGSGLLL